MSHAWVYVAALVLTADAVLFRVVVAVRIARARKRDVVVRDDLSVQELALLAGGRRRVVTTVLARMGRQGRLAVTEDGDRVVLSGTAPDGAADAVEEAVVRAAGVARGERAGKLVAEVADGDAVRSVARRLCADGLLLDPGVLRAQYRARRLLVGAAVLSPALSVYEIVAGDPRLWWAGLALSALAAVPAVLLRPTRRRTPDRVALVLGILRGEHARPPSSRPAGALTALALTPLGTVALAGPAAAEEPGLRALGEAESWRAVDRPAGGDSGHGGSCGYCGSGAGCGAGGGGCGGGGGGGGCGGGGGQ